MTQLAQLSDAPAATLERFLTRACQCLDQVGGDFSPQLRELSALRRRLACGTFRLAVLGQFKRGKSSLLNALLGEPLLPTDILPVTAIPTYIVAAEHLSARVVFSSTGQEEVLYDPALHQSLGVFLERYVTEQGNPDNTLHVERVEIGHYAPLLKQGIVLIDTPGIGSTHRHNTDVAYQVLPQCDAALFVVSPDPPITQAELEYLEAIQSCLPRTFFLLNKIDVLDVQERVASLNFLSHQLDKLCHGEPQILAISAKKALSARLAGDAAAWRESGLEQVEKCLIDFLATEKSQVLLASLQRRSDDILENVLMQLRLSLQALLLPERELEEKIAQFKAFVPEIEREMLAVEDVLKGDHQRLVTVLGQAMNKIRAQAGASILEPLEKKLAAEVETETLERSCRQFVQQVIPDTFVPAMRQVTKVVQREAVELLNIHQRRCDAMIVKIRKVAAQIFAIPYHAPEAEAVYIHFEVPSWSQDLFISDMDPFGQKLSRRFFTKNYRHRKTVTRLREETRKLVGQNVEQISWALRKEIDETFRSYQDQLHEQLEQTLAATRTAMDVARLKTAELAGDAQAPEACLKKALHEIESLRKDAQQLQN